jgi:hypothetical protein
MAATISVLTWNARTKKERSPTIFSENQKFGSRALDWCRRFEIPAPPVAIPSQELQIEKRHWNRMFASALLVFEVRDGGCRAVSQTSKTGH